MNLIKTPLEDKIPDDIYVIIEISLGSNQVKYEINKKNGMIFVDRLISTPIFYPFNYGYINNTLSLDGDPLDALVLTDFPLKLISIIHCRPIGILKMSDEKGEDNKILCIPNYDLTEKYNDILDINDISNYFLNKIMYFFKHYKDLEKNKWVKINKWGNINSAKKEIISSRNRFMKIKSN